MGIPSLSILVHELIKLMYHAKCKDPVFIRLGTSGGIGVEPGTVVIAEGAVNPLLKDQFEQIVLGKVIHRPAKLDKKLAKELKSLADPDTDPYPTVMGKTMATDDFYEGKILPQSYFIR